MNQQQQLTNLVHKNQNRDRLKTDSNQKISAFDNQQQQFLTKSKPQKLFAQSSPIQTLRIRQSTDKNIKQYKFIKPPLNQFNIGSKSQETNHNYELLNQKKIDQEFRQRKRFEEIIKMQAEKLRYQSQENDRLRHFLSIKEQMIENYQWEKKILINKRTQLQFQIEDLKKKIQNSTFMAQPLPKSQLKLQDLSPIVKINSSSEEKSNIEQFEQTKRKNNKVSNGKDNIMREQKDFQIARLKGQLMRNAKEIKELKAELEMMKIDKEHIERQYQILNEKDEKNQLQKNKKDIMNGSKDSMMMLAHKCLSLQSHVEKLTKKIVSPTLDDKRADNCLISHPYQHPPITPHFPKKLSKLFSKVPHEKNLNEQKEINNGNQDERKDSFGN